MEFFQGNTFFKKIVPDGFDLKIGDVFRFAMMRNEFTEHFHDGEIKVESENQEIIIEIESEKTKTFPIGKALLEVELTTIDGIVKTNQYEIEVKAVGIRE